MANKQIGDKYVNKMKVGTETYMDLTDSTTTSSNLLTGAIGYAADGSQVTGACTYNNDTSSDTVAADNVLEGITFHTAATGSAQATGTMPNKGEAAYEVDATTHTTTQIDIPYGYYQNGSKCTITNIVDSMIAQGTTLFGIAGTHGGSLPTQSKTATPKLTAQTVQPDSGYTLSQVTVNATPVVTDSTGAGVLVTICPDG